VKAKKGQVFCRVISGNAIAQNFHKNKWRQVDRKSSSLPPQILVSTVAVTSRMAAAIAVRVAVGTGFATVILAILLNGFGGIDNAQTGLAGTFDLGGGRHHNFS
jgi:hypothetical protein